MADAYVFSELVRASSMLSGERRYSSQISILVEQAQDISHSELAVLYAYSDPAEPGPTLKRVYQRGNYETPGSIQRSSETVDFMEDCRESLILHDTDRPFFADAFLHPAMRSVIVLPLITPTGKMGILFLCSRRPGYYMRDRFLFLDSLSQLAGGMLHNAQLYRELQEQLRHVEELERYQENIFASMTNLLITTDEKGEVHYFNRAALEALGLEEEHIGKDFSELFSGNLSKEVLETIKKANKDGRERLGLQGIITRPQEEPDSRAKEEEESKGAGPEARQSDGGDEEEKEIDFALNISPLQGKRGKREGLTLIFTDQSRERRLQQEMESVVEERRAIKDMFSRYLSTEIVQTLTERPDLVKPGGDKKRATIFFADIRGYTSFSETKPPEYIIDVLNEYFTQAVEVIIGHKGYIDKFIGDAIMAAWGVPIYSEVEDAIAAVSCAVELQELIRSTDRSFFTGDAANLSVGIGMHTGDLVAGNLGSNRRMDYSVIGDTVNVASRLEGIAGRGEVVITETTGELVRDHFEMEEREAVKVKGKIKPIRIYNVVKRIR
jgi:class 3 adenylate cyclase/GAF domain-containing protein